MNWWRRKNLRRANAMLTRLVETHSGVDKQKFAAFSQTALLHVRVYRVYRKHSLREHAGFNPCVF